MVSPFDDHRNTLSRRGIRRGCDPSRQALVVCFHRWGHVLVVAAERGVELTTVVADLADYDLGSERWDLIVSIFAHTPPPVRRAIHAGVASALRPGGRFVLEAYTPDQIGRGTGGPPVPELTMTLAGLRDELTDLDLEVGRELVRPVVEGSGHTGDGAVVQVIARR